MALILILATSATLLAQPAPSVGMSIAQAVEAALRNYPSIQVSQEQMNAAAAGIQLARTTYLPRLDALAQVDRATRNNVFGLMLPQNTIPSISGPVLGTDNFGTAFGSALGMLVTWEPFDFGQRRESVNTATAARTQSEATLKRTRFEVSAAVADACVTLVAAQETVRAAQAGVDRAEIVARTVNAQVNAQLRPGADASRAQAELAAARTLLIQAQQAVEMARVNVSQFVGLAPGQIVVAASKLLQLPPDRVVPPLDTAANPIAVEQSALIDQLKSQLKILERSYFPRFYAQASTYARGTGAETNGHLLGGLNGLAPTIQNSAVGFTVTFPVLDLPAIRAREDGQAAAIRAETARLKKIATDLTAQWNRAVATVNGARNVAANTPVQVAAARAATEQATARYQAGLGNINDVAEAQRLLTQSEIDDALARLGVWRGLLAVATAAGDIRPFVMEASD